VTGPVRAWAAVLAVLGAAGCRDAQVPASPAIDAGHRQRVFQPPPGQVRPAPPYAITREGVGPYRLGARQRDILDLLPHGPRIEILQIEGIAALNLVRSEGGSLVIGSDQEQALVRFVAVLDHEIARTESGVGVGSSLAELREALGPPAVDPDRAADPRLVAAAELPGTRFVLDQGRVVAVLVAAAAPAGPARTASTCAEGGALADAGEALRAAAGLTEPSGSGASVVFGCFTQATAEALVVGAGQVALVSGAPDALRRVAAVRTPHLAYAAAIDVDGDGMDEIALVHWEPAERPRASPAAGIQDRQPASTLWRAHADLFRWDGSRLELFAAHDLYEVTQLAAAWTGADLHDIELLIEIGAGAKELQFGGVYLHRKDGRVSEVAPLLPRVVPLARRRSGDRPTHRP
jgi:hypothetical protein